MTHDNLTLHDIELMLDAAKKTAEGRENAWALWSYSELCRLAMLAIDPQAERDRRVGAAVMAWVGSVPLAALEKTLIDEYAGLGTGVTPRGLMRCLVAALREEAGR